MQTYFTNRELEEAIYLIDENNDGQISFSNFYNICLRICRIYINPLFPTW